MELFHVLSDGPTLNETLNPLPAHVSSYRYCKQSLCRHRQLLLSALPLGDRYADTALVRQQTFR